MISLRLRRVRRVARGTKHQTCRVTKDNPAIARRHERGTELNEALSVSLAVVTAEIDVSPYRGAGIILAEPLEQQLSARPVRRVQLSGEFADLIARPAPTQR